MQTQIFLCTAVIIASVWAEYIMVKKRCYIYSVVYFKGQISAAESCGDWYFHQSITNILVQNHTHNKQNKQLLNLPFITKTNKQVNKENLIKSKILGPWSDLEWNDKHRVVKPVSSFIFYFILNVVWNIVLCRHDLHLELRMCSHATVLCVRLLALAKASVSHGGKLESNWLGLN